MKEVVRRRTKEDMDSMAHEIAMHMLEGPSNDDLIEWVKEKYGVERAMAYRYVANADRVIATTVDLPREFGKAIRKYTRYQKKLDQEQDWEGAARMQDRKVKMFGLNPDRLIVKDERQDGHAALADAINKVAQADRPEVIEASFRELMDAEEESDDGND